MYILSEPKATDHEVVQLTPQARELSMHRHTAHAPLRCRTPRKCMVEINKDYALAVAFPYKEDIAEIEVTVSVLHVGAVDATEGSHCEVCATQCDIVHR